MPANLQAKADPAALMRVLDNLIYNAVKYSPPHSAVQVHAIVENDNIVINVRDEGVGINESGRQKLFQKIARLMVDPAEIKASNGIGMAIVKRCSAVLSGSIRWRRNTSSGSTITLRLPVSSGENDEPEYPGIKFVARKIMDLPDSFHSRN
jgi:K+-sensing histidine kinase KdpD